MRLKKEDINTLFLKSKKADLAFLSWMVENFKLKKYRIGNSRVKLSYCDRGHNDRNHNDF